MYHENLVRCFLLLLLVFFFCRFGSRSHDRTDEAAHLLRAQHPVAIGVVFPQQELAEGAVPAGAEAEHPLLLLRLIILLVAAVVAVVVDGVAVAFAVVFVCSCRGCCCCRCS